MPSKRECDDAGVAEKNEDVPKSPANKRCRTESSAGALSPTPPIQFIDNNAAETSGSVPETSVSGTSTEITEDVQLLTPKYIVGKIREIYDDHRGRMKKNRFGFVFNMEWDVAINCFIDLLSEECFDANDWKTLFSKEGLNQSVKEGTAKTLYPMIWSYVKQIQKEMDLKAAAEAAGNSKNTQLKEDYIKPFYNLFNGCLKEIFCATMVKLFDCLPSDSGFTKKAPSNVSRAASLGEEIINGYIDFQQGRYYDREVWVLKLALPKEQRKRFVLAEAIESHNVIVVKDESENEDDANVTTAASIPKRSFINNKDPDMKLVYNLKRCGVNDFYKLRTEQLEGAKCELEKLQLLVTEKEKEVKKFEADVEKWEKLANQEVVNSKIIEILKVEKNGKRSLLVAKVGTKLLKKYSVEELKFLDANTPVIDLSTFVDSVTSTSTEKENQDKIFIAEGGTFAENDAAVVLHVQGDKMVSGHGTDANNHKADTEMSLAVDNRTDLNPVKPGPSGVQNDINSGPNDKEIISDDEENNVDQDQLNKINAQRVNVDVD